MERETALIYRSNVCHCSFRATLPMYIHPIVSFASPSISIPTFNIHIIHNLDSSNIFLVKLLVISVRRSKLIEVNHISSINGWMLAYSLFNSPNNWYSNNLGTLLNNAIINIILPRKHFPLKGRKVNWQTYSMCTNILERLSCASAQYRHTFDLDIAIWSIKLEWKNCALNFYGTVGHSADDILLR